MSTLAASLETNFTRETYTSEAETSTQKCTFFGSSSKELNTMHEGKNINPLLHTNVHLKKGFERASVDQRSRIDRHTGTKYTNCHGGCLLVKIPRVMCTKGIRGRVDRGSIESIDWLSTTNGFGTHDPINSTVDTASLNTIKICSLSSFFIVMRSV